METLSHNDLLALNRAIGELYTARDLDSFYRSAFSAIQGIIPGEFCGFNDFRANPTRILKLTSRTQIHSSVFHKHLAAFNAHIHAHPVCVDFFSDRVFKTSDRASRREFKSTPIYDEYYRHLDIETQIGMTISIDQGSFSILSLSRRRPDYSERDRLILTLLRPHLQNALRNTVEYDRMRLERDLLLKCAERERQGTILFQSDGRVVCIAPFAKELLAKYFDATLKEGDALPGELLKWFRMGEASRRVERPALTVEKEDRRLTVKLLNDFTTGDYLLVLAETDPSGAMQNLQGYGLSCRETEVLTWLTKGKTNVEIAIILGTSKRTVEKHMEHIFAKLGVETRAAAAMMNK